MLKNRYLLVKRIIDVVLSSTLLVLLIVPSALIALLIVLESPGPAIFRQNRVGKDGKSFVCYKLRSMYQLDSNSGANFTLEHDDRITFFGHVIRKLRIDEWPQLWNVIRGDMSIIGPRPEQCRLMADIQKEVPEFQLRHVVRPGITGWAQINQGYAGDVASMSRKLSLDLWYIENMSFRLDMLIAFKTIKVVFSGYGSR